MRPRCLNRTLLALRLWILVGTPVVVLPGLLRAEMVISEILYDADPSNAGGEFIELVNTGSEAVDMGGWVLGDAVDYTFPPGTLVAPGEFVVVARSAASASSFYGIDVIGQYNGRLGNGGDNIVLSDDALPRQVRDVVSYDDEFPWPTEADGGGTSLELDPGAVNNNNAASWLIGQPYSPGAPNDPTTTNGGDVVISEIMYKPLREEFRETFDRVSRNTYMERDTDDFGEYVEITNRGDEAVDLEDWAFTNGIDFTFGAGTLEPGEYLVVAADPEITGSRFAGVRVLGPFDGSLSDGGERLTLNDGNGDLVDTVAYDDRQPFPVSADEFGFSIEVVDIHEDNGTAANWRASTGVLPEPGLVLDEGGVEGGWIPVEIRGEAPSNRLYIFVEGPGEWLIDDVQIVASDGGENLIANGGFEVDDFGWRKVGNHEGSFRTEEFAHSGVACERLVATGAGSNLTNCFMVSRVDGLVPEQNYVLSLFARHLSGHGTLRVRLSGQGFDTTVIQGIESNSLADEWSDDSNPNGQWLYADRAGNALSEKSASWLAAELGAGQPAWTLGGDEGTPGWCRSVGSSPSMDFPAGMVGTHGPSRLTWTAPFLGQVTVEGRLYLPSANSDDQHWSISVNDTVLTEGVLRASEGEFGSNNPKPFSSGAAGESALTFFVEPGDEVRFDFRAVEDGEDDFVFLDLDLGFVGGSLPEPPVLGVVGQGSPGQENSVSAEGVAPLVSDLRHLVETPSSNEDVPVVVRVTSMVNVDTVGLEYALGNSTGFVALEMLDDGLSGDGSAGDGMFGATIPGQPSQTLVHYRVRAVDEDGRETVFPYPTDPSWTQAYYHYDGEIDTPLTLYDLYLTAANLGTLLANPRSDRYVDASLVVNGIAYPHMSVRKRGRNTRVHPKHQWKFRFNRDRLFRGDGFHEGVLYGNGDRVVDLMLNQPYGQEMSFRIMDLSGAENFEHDLVRVHHNGSFFGVYVAFESPNSSWLRKHGFDAQDEIYKPRSSETPNRTLNADYYHNDIDTDFEYWGVWNKKVRSLERPTEMRELVSALNDLDIESFRDWATRRIDVDQWLTRWADYILMNIDDFTTNNHYLHLEGAGSESGGRWKWYSYDFDSGFTYNRVGPIRALYGDGKSGDNPDWQQGRWQRIVSDDPVLRRVYFLILRDMMDEVYLRGTVFSMMDELFELATPDRLLDVGRWSTMRLSTNEMKSVFDGQRARTDEFLSVFPMPGHEDTPTASPAGGEFDGNVQVVLTEFNGYVPYYTLDGTDPRLSLSRMVYEGPFEISESTTLQVAGLKGAFSLGDWTRVNRYGFQITRSGVGPFTRGDCDGDGVGPGDVNDALRLLVYNFRGGTPPPCNAACDANGDGDTGGVSDAIWMLVHSFLQGALPVAPYPECGFSELARDEVLGCLAPTCR